MKGEQYQCVLCSFFRRATAKIPDGKKKIQLPVRLNVFCRWLNGFQNTRLTTGLDPTKFIDLGIVSFLSGVLCDKTTVQVF